ncbi:RIP metalloprotease RseP [Desulfoplanes sp.]
MILSTLAIILVLGALIFFHELGHFLVARSMNIGVKAFSLGFGPRIWKKTWGETEYRLSALPLGGYVQLVGENVDDELPEGFLPGQSFALRPPWQRMLVVAAGPVFNFILAWLIYWGIFFAQGQTQLLPTIGDILPDSPAQAAGIEPGDQITAVDGRPITYWQDLSRAIQASRGNALALAIDRQTSLVTVQVTPHLQERKNIFGETKMVPMVGITAAGETTTIKLSPLEAGWEGMAQTWALSKLTFQGLVKLVERVVPLDNIGGPIMIAQMVGQQAHEGLVNLLAITALISINLGLLNLLPIPVLDGGHILFCLIEMVRRRPLDERLQQITMRLGLAFLLALMGLAIFNDIWRQFN